MAVQVSELLFANVSVCEPVPNSIEPEAVTFNVFIVSSNPVVAPVDKVPPLMIKLDALLIVLAAPKINLPLDIVVEPVYVFAPDKARFPDPDFVNEPFVLPPEAPDIVNVVAPVLTSIILVVAEVKVNALSVLAVEPVYCKVPPPKTMLLTELVA